MLGVPVAGTALIGRLRRECPRPARAPLLATERRRCRRRRGWRRSGTSRAGGHRVALHRRRHDGVGAAGGSSRPRHPPIGRRRSPPATGALPHRRSNCTTGPRHECGARRSGSGRTPPGHGCSRSGRQPGPTLGPARLQDGAPGACRHAVPESVTLRPASVVGLVGALHPCLLEGQCNGAGIRVARQPSLDNIRTTPMTGSATGRPNRLGATTRASKSRPGERHRKWYLRHRMSFQLGKLALALASSTGGTVANLLGRLGGDDVSSLSTACGWDCGRRGR